MLSRSPPSDNKSINLKTEFFISKTKTSSMKDKFNTLESNSNNHHSQKTRRNKHPTKIMNSFRNWKKNMLSMCVRPKQKWKYSKNSCSSKNINYKPKNSNISNNSQPNNNSTHQPSSPNSKSTNNNFTLRKYSSNKFNSNTLNSNKNIFNKPKTNNNNTIT